MPSHGANSRVRTLVWFRGKDLRVSDHAPLVDAAKNGLAIPLFVLDPYFFAPARAQELPHRMQFLLSSIEALASNLAHLGSRLVLVAGKSIEEVPRVAKALSVDRVVAHRWSEPFARVRDERVGEALGVPFELYEGETLAPPGSVRTGEGNPFSVFTPFARAHRAVTNVSAPLRAPKALPPVSLPRGVVEVPLPSLADLGIESNPRILEGGERAARARLKAFLKGPAAHYETLRDRMDEEGTSRLSADLKFGTLSARQAWFASRAALERPHPEAWRSFSNELLWREFTHMLLYERPELLREPARPAWKAFPWRRDEAAWRAWCEGTTGYPIVDAAARELLAEGYVPNRARMIAASFLVKHLLIDFRRGEARYLTYLTDGDWAQNDAGWQWSAGCGYDAQPYHRVFNPVLQGRRFDPSGGYVRRWVPELAKLQNEFIHAPWEAPADVLRGAGVVLGKTYPKPIVDHATARARFLSVASSLSR